MTLLTIEQAARELTVSKSTVERLVRAGRLRVIRPSPGTVRITRDEVNAYLASLRRAS